MFRRFVLLVALLASVAHAADLKVVGPAAPIRTGEWTPIRVSGLDKPEAYCDPSKGVVLEILKAASGEFVVNFKSNWAGSHKVTIGQNVEHVAWIANLTEGLTGAGQANADPVLLKEVQAAATKLSARYPSQSASVLVDVRGSTPVVPVPIDPTPVPPVPDPIPDPTVDNPFNKPGLHVLMLEETDDRGNIDRGQLNILRSAIVGKYIRDHVARDGNNLEWRGLDDDHTREEWAISGQSAMWQNAYFKGLELADKADGNLDGVRVLPWALIGDGQSLFSGPLPKGKDSIEQFLAILKKYGDN